MEFRVAMLSDIPGMQVVRHAVKENTLSDPALVSDQDCADYLQIRGRGWVCISGKILVGFSIVDLVDHNVWALFVHPEHEKRGIGRRLHDQMLDWYFEETHDTLWLGTAPFTRAEIFYRKTGWITNGIILKGELRFEMTFDCWQLRAKK